jgi:hypothetical protein
MKRQRRELGFRVCLAISLLASLSLAWCAAAEYWASPGLLTGNPENDLGDAPDSSNSYGVPMRAYPDGTVAHYPTVYGSGSPPYGPIHWRPKAVAYLGHSVTLESEADLGPDEDGVNNIQPLDDSSNRDGGDDGVRLPLVLPNDQAATLEYTVTVVNPLPGVMYVNVWFDWNRDGDWDDTLTCPNGAPAPEWAVQNQVVSLPAPGEFRVVTPPFVCWHPPQGTDPAPIWMRITLSDTPWPPAGQSPLSGGCGPVGGYLYGETEDYYLCPTRQAGAADYGWIDKSNVSAAGGDLKVLAVSDDPQAVPDPVLWVQATEDPVWKWSQWPDMTSDGIGIRVDNSDQQKRALADDFECKNSNCISGVRLWGSWKNDQKGQITKIRLRIHDDDPVGTGGSDRTNTFSKPRPEIRWQKEFGPGQFEEVLYYVQAAAQWWWDPATGLLAEGSDTGLWQITIDIAPGDAFRQEGLSGSPRIYWLAVEVETAGGQFGWKARRQPDHSMDDAVWDAQASGSRIWHELRYPAGHPRAVARQTSVDMAFCLKYADCTSVPTVQPGSSTQCPAVSTTCPTVSTQCPAVSTTCPATTTTCQGGYTQCAAFATTCTQVSTQCPLVDTQCPVKDTTCPLVPTKCPIPPATVYPPVDTMCQTVNTKCPVVATSCPPVSTQCPVVDTKCPVKDTTCPLAGILTKCPTVTTACPGCPSTVFPPVDTMCQTVNTQCPVVDTKCPVKDTQCPATPVSTHCPEVPTKCPPIPPATFFPPVDTMCQTVNTKCPVVATSCPPVDTKCPVKDTTCPATPVSTQCPTNPTQCPPLFTFCPPSPTNCPIMPTICGTPPLPTVCPITDTQCPAVSTKCPTEYTKCPAQSTKCPAQSTKCPTEVTNCPGIYTVCPAIDLTKCPPVTTFCPEIHSICPITSCWPFGKTPDTLSGSRPPTEMAYPSASQTLLKDALSGSNCPTVETTVPMVVAGGR